MNEQVEEAGFSGMANEFELEFGMKLIHALHEVIRTVRLQVDEHVIQVTLILIYALVLHEGLHELSLQHVDDDVGVDWSDDGSHGSTIDLMVSLILKGEVRIVHHKRDEIHDELDVIIVDLLLDEKLANQLQAELSVDVGVQRRNISREENSIGIGHWSALDVVDERLGIAHDPWNVGLSHDLL